MQEIRQEPIQFSSLQSEAQPITAEDPSDLKSDTSPAPLPTSSIPLTRNRSHTKIQADAPLPACDKIMHIPTSKIVPNPNQPRKSFSQPSILKLADSIRQFGIIQPLTVRNSGQNYELIAGERRLRAAKELNLTTVPCIVTNSTDEHSAQISIIENLLRENLNMFEEAEAIESLIDTYGLTQEEIAQKLSCSQSYIANKLRLLRIAPELRSIITENKLTERHARAILRVNDPNLRHLIVSRVISGNLNVSQTEALVESSLICTEKPIISKSIPKHAYKDAESFYNAISKALLSAKSSNLDIKSRKIVGESFTEITIIIPNQGKANK